MESESANSEIVQTTPVDARLQAFAMCMICNAEYPPNTSECPNCKVPLSVVRRCHSCSHVVSAKHRRCIHCGLAFFSEGQEQTSRTDTLDQVAEFRKKRELARHRTSLRGLTFAVPVFLTVLFAALLLTHQFSQNTASSTIATSYVLRSTELRHAPSNSSSNVGTLSGGELIDIIGYVYSGADRGWVVVSWKSQTAYLGYDAIGPPRVADPARGFGLLKSYIAGIEEPSIIPEAVKAVTYYVQAFPSQGVPGQELRWVLADRARQLAARGKLSEELVATARAQYQVLIDANSSFAERAKKAINVPFGERTYRRPHSELSFTAREPDTSTITIFEKTPSHEVTLLEHANVAVLVSASETLRHGGTIGCSVARTVQSNGRAVIPAGAPCKIKVMSLQAKTATLTLAEVTVRNHSYELLTRTVNIRNEVGAERTGHEVSFQLRAPVAFTE